VLHIAKEIAKGFFFLHQNKIIYRDLKLENILIIMPSELLEELKRGSVNCLK